MRRRRSRIRGRQALPAAPAAPGGDRAPCPVRSAVWRSWRRHGIAACLLAALALPAAARAAEPSPRVSFLVSAVEETPAGRAPVGRTRVEGPAGTDFTIFLETGPFEMEARFRTDLSGPDGLTIRSRLRTRRSLGLSERGFPLYEEDVQRSRMDLGFDEALALLPFGGRDAEENLRIEIVPSLIPEARPGPLEIRILDPAPGGALRVHAERIPHRFLAEARLLAGGREVAAGSAEVYLEEPGLLRLAAREGTPGMRGDVMEIDLAVGAPGRACPGGPLTLAMDLRGLGPRGRVTEIGRGWAGAAPPGTPMGYDIETGPPGLEGPARLEITIHPEDGSADGAWRDTP